MQFHQDFCFGLSILNMSLFSLYDLHGIYVRRIYVQNSEHPSKSPIGQELVSYVGLFENLSLSEHKVRTISLSHLLLRW